MCETGELMAANQRMGNTVGVSTVLTQNELYEGGDFPLVNRSRMVSLSRAD